MDKEKMKRVASKLLFKVDESVLRKMELEFDALQKEIDKMSSIDTSEVEPLSRIGKSNEDILREDVPKQTLDRFILKKNAPEFDEDKKLVVVGKVVKNVFE